MNNYKLLLYGDKASYLLMGLAITISCHSLVRKQIISNAYEK